MPRIKRRSQPIDPKRRLDSLKDPNNVWRRLYVRGECDDLEQFSKFRPGGYYPVHLQEEIHHGRYRIIHKLGHGGLGTVWLSLDQHAEVPTYVAVKIIVAIESAKENADLLLAEKLQSDNLDKTSAAQHLCLPREHFTIQSPNGDHMCLVYPVLGPTVRETKEVFDLGDSFSRTAQDIARQIVDGLVLLHRTGICHADFRPDNVLLGLQALDGLSEEEVLESLEEPYVTSVHVRQEADLPSELPPYAPIHLVYPIDFTNADEDLILPFAHIIDFGQSFDVSRLQPATYGIPLDYAAPEVVLDNRMTAAMDIWSLGCTLFEMRVGKQLFNVFQLLAKRKVDYVDEIATLLGRPPEPWAEEYFESDDESGEDSIPSQNFSREERVRSIYNRLSKCHDCVAPKCGHPGFRIISETEAADLADLLEQLLRYKPEERLGTEEVLKHPWFNTNY